MVSIMRHCLALEEVEVVLNACHSGACGGHLFGLAATQKILRAGIFGRRFLKTVWKW